VKKPGARVNGRQQEQLEALRKLAATLGAHLLIEEGHDVAETAARVGAQRGTTYVLLGQPRSASGLRRFGVSLPEKLIEHMPGVDIRIVADRTKKRQ
jgi:two-component system, OmpR family, sensor histidine kinase KdpD